MKILYSWLNDFIDLSTIEINDVVNGLTNIGLEVESVDEYNIDFDILDNLVVGEVIECYKHPHKRKLKSHPHLKLYHLQYHNSLLELLD